MDTPYGTILKCYALAGPISYWVPAPFGRFNVASRFSLPGRASFMIQEVVGPICFLYRLLSYGSSLSGLQQLASAMFVLHYLNRSILFPLFVQPSYSDSHLGVVLSAGLWQLCNGNIQAMAVHKLPRVSGLRTTLALLVFAVGMFGNIYHDRILARLRSKPGSKRYGIPYGGLFSLVSYPHYLCEWIEWTGYGLLIGHAGSYAGFWFVFLEVMVMLPRALLGHAWYATEGLHLPPSRRAILPYLL